jgi:hypothetical protein
MVAASSVGQQILQQFSGSSMVVMNRALGWFIGGWITARALRREQPALPACFVPLVAGAWALGGPLYWRVAPQVVALGRGAGLSFAALQPALDIGLAWVLNIVCGSLLTLVLLRRGGRAPRLISVLAAVGGWLGAWAASSALLAALEGLRPYGELERLALEALGGLAFGVIGGAAMLIVLRRAGWPGPQQHPEESRTPLHIILRRSPLLARLARRVPRAQSGAVIAALALLALLALLVARWQVLAMGMLNARMLSALAAVLAFVTGLPCLIVTARAAALVTAEQRTGRHALLSLTALPERDLRWSYALVTLRKLRGLMIVTLSFVLALMTAAGYAQQRLVRYPSDVPTSLPGLELILGGMACGLLGMSLLGAALGVHLTLRPSALFGATLAAPLVMAALVVMFTAFIASGFRTTPGSWLSEALGLLTLFLAPWAAGVRLLDG